MTVNNGNRITAPLARVFQAVRPKAKPAPAPAPQLAADANQTAGQAKYTAGVKAAKTGELAGLPFANTWWGQLRNRFIDTRVTTEATKAAAFVDRWKGKFNEQGQVLLERVANNTSPDGIRLRQQVNRYLKQGGNAETAHAIMKQLSAPDTYIGQANEMTCAAATAQKALAHKDPAKYFRIMADLAGDGQTKFPGLGEIAASKESIKDIKREDFNKTQELNALMQAALMEKFNGKATYDFSEDTSVSRNLFGMKKERKGLSAEQAESLTETLVQCETTDPDHLKRLLHEGEKRGARRGDILKSYLNRANERAEEKDDPGFFLAIHSKKGVAHMVLVRDVNTEAGTVTFEDARGRKRTRSLDGFVGRIAATNNVDVGGGRVRIAAATTTGEV